MVSRAPGGDVYPRQIVAVMGVVTDASGRVLLVEGDRRGWEPPGGQVELGEDLVTALKREIREESGCGAEDVKLVGVYSNLGRLSDGKLEQLNFSFSCRWTAGEPCAGDECSRAGWFAVEDALKMVEARQQRDKLQDVVDAAHGVRYRAYRTYPYEVSLETRC